MYASITLTLLIWSTSASCMQALDLSATVAKTTLGVFTTTPMISNQTWAHSDISSIQTAKLAAGPTILTPGPGITSAVDGMLTIDTSAPPIPSATSPTAVAVITTTTTSIPSSTATASSTAPIEKSAATARVLRYGFVAAAVGAMAFIFSEL